LGGPNRIEVGEIGLRHEAKHPAVGRPADPRSRQKADRARGGAQKIPSSHCLCNPCRPVEMPGPACRERVACLMSPHNSSGIRAKRRRFASPHHLAGRPHDMAQVAEAAGNTDAVEILQHDDRQVTTDAGSFVEFSRRETRFLRS